MVAILDSLSPFTVGSDKIVITRADSTAMLAFSPIIFDFDYSAADPGGVVLPIELIVQPTFEPGGAGGGFKSKIFRKASPSSYTYTPPAAGTYLMLIREMYHNKWQGRFLFVVEGDTFSTVETERLI